MNIQTQDATVRPVSESIRKALLPSYYYPKFFLDIKDCRSAGAVDSFPSLSDCILEFGYETSLEAMDISKKFSIKAWVIDDTSGTISGGGSEWSANDLLAMLFKGVNLSGMNVGFQLSTLTQLTPSILSDYGELVVYRTRPRTLSNRINAGIKTMINFYKLSTGKSGEVSLEEVVQWFEAAVKKTRTYG
jgi:hypothetical protein